MNGSGMIKGAHCFSTRPRQNVRSKGARQLKFLKSRYVFLLFMRFMRISLARRF